MSEVMEIVVERRTKQPQQHQKKQPNKRREKRTKRDTSYSEMLKAKWFCCAFKLGFLQLICKASSIFKSKLELALSINLIEREFLGQMHVTMECRYLKIFIFDMVWNVAHTC